MSRGGASQLDGKIVKVAVVEKEELLRRSFSWFQGKRWAQDGLFLLVACIAGIMFGSLLNTNDIVPRHPEIGVIDIFSHNFFIALVVGFLTYYAALPVFAFNAFFLGINLCLYAKVAGLPELLSLSALHVPLEMFAWLLTLGLARSITGFYRQLGSEFFGENKGQRLLGRRGDRIRAFAVSAGRSVMLVAVTYAAAAVAEYYELKIYLER